MMHIGSGNRGEWEFEYTAKNLAAAAATQRDYRQSRVDVWTKQKDDLMAKVRSDGISVSESVADKMSAYSSNLSANGPQIPIDPQMQRQLTECHAKIQAHRLALAEYDGWVQVLEANPESRLKLTQADWLYFFGKI